MFLGCKNFGHFNGHIDSTVKTGPDDSAVTNTIEPQANFPRGLVVRIRRSHRRGPGSNLGVGISFLLPSLGIHIASRNYTIMAIF